MENNYFISKLTTRENSVSLPVTLNSSDEFSVATPDETTVKETEFSLVVSLEIK